MLDPKTITNGKKFSCHYNSTTKELLELESGAVAVWEEESLQWCVKDIDGQEFAPSHHYDFVSRLNSYDPEYMVKDEDDTEGINDKQIKTVSDIIRFHYVNIHQSILDNVKDEETRLKILAHCAYLEYDRYNITNLLKDKNYQIGTRSV